MCPVSPQSITRWAMLIPTPATLERSFTSFSSSLCSSVCSLEYPTMSMKRTWAISRSKSDGISADIFAESQATRRWSMLWLSVAGSLTPEGGSSVPCPPVGRTRPFGELDINLASPAERPIHLHETLAQAHVSRPGSATPATTGAKMVTGRNAFPHKLKFLLQSDVPESYL